MVKKPVTAFWSGWGKGLAQGSSGHIMTMAVMGFEPTATQKQAQMPNLLGYTIFVPHSTSSFAMFKQYDHMKLFEH